MPASNTSAPIAASEPSDLSASPQNPVEEKFAVSTESNVGSGKGRKHAWNVPSGTATPESACPGMDAATWPVLAANSSSRASPKSSSTASSSTDDVKSLSDVSAVSVPAVRNYISSPETVVVPAPQQPRPNLSPNLMRRGSTGSENTHAPQPNNRSSRWVHGPNRRGNNNNNHHHHHHNNNNSGGGYRGRDRGGSNWNPSWNNSTRSPHFYRGNQAMTTPQHQPQVYYGYGVPTAYPAYFPPMGYDVSYAMYGHAPMNAQQWVTPMAPGYSAEVLEQRNAIMRQIEYYFSTENLCKDTYLRKNMDEQGWVPISLVANFNRVKQLTNDLQLIPEIIKGSTVVEVQGNKLRRRDDWMTWILPPAPQLETVASQLEDLSIGPTTAISSLNIGDLK